jgi:phospholipase C
MANQLSKIDHIVMLLLEKRSFDHMLGFLYADSGNRSPAGQEFDGLTGEEWNPDDLGRQIRVYKTQKTAVHPLI